MQLPDENIEYQYQRLVVAPAESWGPLAELQAQHLLAPERLEAVKASLNTVRGQVAAERELANPPAKLLPLQAGFIDLPQKLLDGFRRKQDASDLGKVLRIANRLKESVDRVVLLGSGGNFFGPRAIIEALGHAYHNEMPAKLRMGKPRIYFEGYTVDNDPLQELFELLENTCVDPEIPEERWGIVVAGKSGNTLETATAYRAVKIEAAKYYGPKSEMLRKVVVPITGAKSKLRELFKADGYTDDDILSIPEDVGGRFSVFTPVGLLPAAVVGLDVRALLLGAATMTKRFIEEPFDRNPVLQFAAVNYLMTEELKKTTRVFAIWSRKLEAVGQWYDNLLTASLGKASRGPNSNTLVLPRDLHGRGQMLHEGPRDKLVNNLVVRSLKHPPVLIGMGDRNEDDLNSISRKGHPDVMDAAIKGFNESLTATARPSTDITLPTVTEHTIGQLLQMLMLSTVVEGRLMGMNPYGQPAIDAYKSNLVRLLKSTPNLPKGEVRDQAKGV